MKIDLNTPFRTLDGDIVVRTGSTEALAVREVLVNACITPQEQDSKTPGQAYRLYKLANLLHNGGAVVDLAPEDCAFLRQRVETAGYPPMTVGQVTDLLNGA